MSHRVRRSPFTSGLRLLPAIALLFALSACGSHPIWLAGHSADYKVVYEGQGTSSGATSQYVITGSPGGVSCQGTGTNSFTGLQGNWANTLTCSDGRTASFPIALPAGVGWTDSSAIWYGTASFRDGSSIVLAQSAKTRPGVMSQLAEFRKRQQAATEPVATRAPLPATSAGPPRAAAVAGTLAERPLALAYRRGAPRPDDIAVIIGNADYRKQGRDIPNVDPAYSDAASFRRFAIEALGIREGNIIQLKDATSAQIIRVFGTADNPRGQLFNWVKPGLSRVYVYYAGHGAPAGRAGTAYLVPADAAANAIALNGYPLSTLYRNLATLPARSVTVVLEACFSGASQSGSLIPKASPVFVQPKRTEIPQNITVISAGAEDQLASWEEDGSHGLFTKHYLTAMSGAADDNKDGTVDMRELRRYLDGTLTYLARRYYGRDQNAQISVARQ